METMKDRVVGFSSAFPSLPYPQLLPLALSLAPVWGLEEVAKTLTLLYLCSR